MKFRVLAAVSTVSFSLLGAATVPATAQSSEVLVSCAGLETSQFSPGLTLLPRQTTIHADADYTCTGVPVEWRGATSHTDGTAVASCATLSLPQVRENVRFTDNDRAVIFYQTAAAGRVGGVNVVILTGQVESGPYTGHTAIKTVELVPAELPTECATQDGLDTSTGSAQLQLLG